MKKILYILFIFLSLPAFAQETKEPGKAVCNIITYNAAGSPQQTGYGFFIDENGTFVSLYSLFQNAVRADVVDSKGKRFPVERVMGANSSYDVIKCRAKVKGSVPFLQTLDKEMTVREGENLVQPYYATDKKAKPLECSVAKVEEWDAYKYFTLTTPNEPKFFGCPVVTTEGKVVGMVQHNVGKEAKGACALDIQTANDLKVTAQSVFNADMNRIAIPKALPADRNEALSFAFLSMRGDSVLALTALNDFLERYPDDAEGLTNRATFFANHSDFSAADADFRKALEHESPDFSQAAVHNAYSKAVYVACINTPERKNGIWSMEKALEEAQKAYEAEPLPLYLVQQSNCLLALSKFQQAYETLQRVNETDLASDETYYLAAMALETAGGDSVQVLALLDSAINRLSRPYSRQSIGYFLVRAQRLAQAGQYRKAVRDLDEYESAIGPKYLNAAFYYMREQAELEAHMYQQALDDIHSALLEPGSNFELYKAEEALIYLRAGMFEEALKSAEELRATNKDNADSYKLAGIALGELGKKNEARTNLQKALELGDETAKIFLERYK